MEVSKETYEEIKQKMIKAGYDDVFHSHEKGPVIDMNGIAIQAKVDPVPQRTEIELGPEKEAWQAWEEDQKTNPNAVNPHAFVYGYKIGKAKAKATREAKDKEDRDYHGRRDLGFSAGHLDGDL